jgi:tetratricopeptide (TPR) repeat protein
MKKNLYTFLVSATAGLLACIFLFSKKADTKVPSFKERMGNVGLSAEWMNSKKAMQGLLAAIEQDPEDHKSMLQLSQAYIQEGRITGDHGYYDKAALELLNKVLEKEPNNFEALCCKATVLLSQHHFAEGLDLAKKALPINHDNAFIYGIMCDANLELGNYDEAVKMADKMVSVRPDIRSYSRVSYLREIYGDVPGAKQAIKLAIAAGYPGLEQTEWTRCVLGHLYESSGELDSAEYIYKVALQERPEYAYAIAGIGRVAKARGNYKDAIFYFEKAKRLVLDFSFSDELTDLYRLDKQIAEADENSKEVIEMLGPDADVEGENGHGHYADKELAYAYLKVNDVENALKHALLEYNRRPANIEISETLAWVKYKKGEYAEANSLINTALRTHSKDPVLLTHAGLIKIKAGETEKGMALIRTATETNPFMDLDLRHEASSYLAIK